MDTSLSQTRWFRVFATILFLVGPRTNPWASAAPTLVVHAGDYNRIDCPATVQLPPEEVARGWNRLISEDGVITPLQVAPDGEASFLLARLSAHSVARFRLGREDAPAPVSVRAVRQGSRLVISDDAPILAYQAEPGPLPRSDIPEAYLRGGYIHPVITPEGRTVTDDFPTNHIHHHGIWFPWTNTEFQGRKPDFWNMGNETGRVEFIAIDDSWSGSVHAGFISRHKFVDLTTPTPTVALWETWTIKVYPTSRSGTAYRLFEMTSHQTCATEDPLILPEYRYGGLGFRGRREWDGAENCFFLTSLGESDRVKAHKTRARWCHIYGKVEGGEFAGITVIGHPDNFRAPQPMRVHPNEPFFNFAPSQTGDWAIEPGKPYVSRYRFVVTDGPSDAALFHRLWQDFATPPTVELTNE